MQRCDNSVPERPRKLENYIPIRFADLSQKLVDESSEHVYPIIVWDPQRTEFFFEFCRRLSLRNKLRIAEEFGDWKEDYAFLDPDVDVVLPASTPPKQRERDVDRFKDTLRHLLDKGGFDEIREEDFEAALEEKSMMGLEVQPPSKEKIHYELFYRGVRRKQVQYRSWKSCFLLTETTIRVYQRLVMIFTKVDREEDQVAPLCLDWFSPKNTIQEGYEEKGSGKGLWYMKMFKDVAQSDIDMILPESEVKFSWIDYMMIWVPVLIGMGTAIYKSAQGTFDFSTHIHIITSVVLIAVPLTWAVKAYQKFKQKQDAYHAHLTQLLLLHNLANNSGVLSTLLDEAGDQEDNEALLAYYFLWRGEDEPAPMSQPALDKQIEKFLNKFMKENNLRSRINFDVVDACEKLEKMGFLNRVPDGEGNTLLKVKGLKEALAAMETYTFDKRLKSYGGKKGGGDEWQECYSEYPKTGQRVRYFWNERTGESSYNVPEKYKPAPI